MKKFTCLLIAFLAINSSYCALTKCAAAATDHSFYGRINTYTASTAITGTSTEAGDGTVCGVTAASGDMHCAKKTEFKNAVSTELTRVKTALTDFGGNVAKIGAMWAKIGSLVNATTAAATIDGLDDAGRSTATAAQLKTWGAYTPANFDTDFTNFKSQAQDCFTAYAQAIKKIGCDAIAAQDTTWANVARWNTDTSISITQAGCNYLVTNCGKVWNFMHKFGWFVQVAATLNKKKDTTVTFTAPANLAAIYAPGAGFGTALTFADIDTAVTKCGVATPGADCGDTEKGYMCRAFFAVWLGASPAVTPFGRGSAAFMKDYNPASAGTARRMLVAETTGAIKIAASTIDVQTAQAITATPDVTFVTADDTKTWSTGYVAPSSSSSGTSSGTSTSSSSNAKVLLGTLLSFLAVALLN